MGQPVAETDRLQSERFLAFAFAAGDLLMEVDGEGVIRFCRGTSDQLLGCKPAQLEGQPLEDAVPANYKVIAQEILRRLRETGRARQISIEIQCGHGDSRLFSISGILLPDRGGTYNLVCSRELKPKTPPKAEMDTEEFGDAVQESLKKAKELGQDVNLSLLDISQATQAEGMDPEKAKEVEAAAVEALRAWAVPDGPVAKLEDGKIGLVHDAEIGEENIGKRVNDLLKNLTGRQDLEVQTATIEAAAEGLSEGDVSKALAHTIKKFVDEGTENLSGMNLADGYQSAVADNLARVQNVRSIIDSADFTLHFQPIVDLEKWGVHHFEALARIREGNEFVPPGRIIAFAEEVGIITDFDEKVCRKAISMVRAGNKIPSAARIAINLSGRSVANMAFMDDLLDLLKANSDICNRLMVEVTEYTEIKDLGLVNNVLDQLRNMKIQVCIDDFGAGAATFQYLAGLQVDFVKIDGQYIREAFTKIEGRPFLKAIAGLCRDLKIRTIGEMVENEKTVWLLHDLGVNYAQGHFFGRAMANVSNFDLGKTPRK
ncbi:Putative signal transduction protein containing sensor and EAL domains [Magnetospira sp. QH-2]|nr:Putative signal transduction protein containing sensor and EAL domains [Magnetospira sp. QH-2]